MKAREKFRDRLYRVSPYSNEPPDNTKFDTGGWGLHPLFIYLISHLKPQTIVEVGTWLGNSAIHMAEVCVAQNLDTEIICIDTFCGSAEHWLGGNLPPPRHNGQPLPDLYDILKIENGRPTLYERFLNNVKCKNLTNIITPFPISSEAAFYVLEALKCSPDLIYIDAGHEYDSVKHDLSLWSTLLPDDGVILLDDYMSWPGVTTAVHEFIATETDWIFVGEFGKAVLTKNDRLRLSTKIGHLS